MSKRYIVSNHKVMQDDRVVWSMSEDDLLKSWTETFADLLNAETAPLLERIAGLENEKKAENLQQHFDATWTNEGCPDCYRITCICE